MERPQLKKGELALIVLSLLILGGAGFVYFTGFPIGKYLLGLTEGASAKQVATLAQAEGTVRRQKEGDTEFQGVANGSPLYDEDTIVTSPDSTDRIVFQDGSYIEMAPSTMVRLSFGASLTLGGVVRTASVEVVSGHVTGETKSQHFMVKNRGQLVALQRPVPRPKPTFSPRPIPSFTPLPRPSPIPSASPSPSPKPSTPPPVAQRFEMIFPKAQAQLAVAKGSQVAEVPLTFQWKLTPPSKTVEFLLVRRGVKSQIIFKKDIAMRSNVAQLPLALKMPGTYRWAIGSVKNRRKIYGYADFTVSPWYEAIQLNPPLFGGQAVESSQLRGKVLQDYGIHFSWQPYGNLQNYEVAFYAPGKFSVPVWARTVPGTNYDMNRGKVFTGRAYYRIIGRLPSGFIALSPIEQFEYDFVPPSPVTPVNGTQLSKRDVVKQDGTVLLTWEKTNFTSRYRIQISTDPGFAAPIVNTMATENFYALKSPQAGTYYWRVQSFTNNGKASAMSAPFSLTITP